MKRSWRSSPDGALASLHRTWSRLALIISGQYNSWKLINTNCKYPHVSYIGGAFTDRPFPTGAKQLCIAHNISAVRCQSFINVNLNLSRFQDAELLSDILRMKFCLKSVMQWNLHSWTELLTIEYHKSLVEGSLCKFICILKAPMRILSAGLGLKLCMH